MNTTPNYDGLNEINQTLSELTTRLSSVMVSNFEANTNLDKIRSSGKPEISKSLRNCGLFMRGRAGWVLRRK